MIPLSDGIAARRFPIVNVAFFAHVGGFVFGVIAARVLVAIGPRTLNHGVAVQRG